MLAIWTLSNLALDEYNKREIAQSGAVDYLKVILENSENDDILTKCMWLLTNLTSDGIFPLY